MDTNMEKPVTAKSKKLTEPETKPEPRMVTIMLPIARDGERDREYVSVNNKTWMIMRGERVEVPINVAYALERAEKARLDQLRYDRQTRTDL